MKSLTMRFTIAAAAFVAVAGVASAQTMEAKIPFAFHANGKALPAGTYRVTLGYGSAANPIVRISNSQTLEQSLALAFANADPKKSWVDSGDAVLEFRCDSDSSHCALNKLWTGTPGTAAYTVPMPNFGKDNYRITAEIVMHRIASE